MRPPRSTYRLQIRNDFDLDAAADLVDYLVELGIDWLYLSPVLTAAPGSTHGYDVVDATTVDPERGGAEALRRLADAAHERGMGVLIDIVPNHMGVEPPEVNAWWADVLRNGRASPYASTFDIDWEAGDGRLRLPVLGDQDDEPQIHEHYELIHWRRADTDLNYRRFFAVNSLAGVRVEDRHVFERTHAEIGRWFAEGIADGLRVDHPDGLAAPKEYLDELAAFTGCDYVLVEKILVGREALPDDWRTAGTTGYDALADIDRVLVDPAGEPALTALDTELRGGADAPGWEDMIHATKRGVADGILQSEVRRLVRDLRRSGFTGDDARLADAVAELLACFPVYRSYLPHGEHHLDTALELATTYRPDIEPTLRTVADTLGDATNPAAIRFQQTSGMVMAKGVEDCAFYRFNRLGTLTEVGGDPSEFAISVDEFHRRQQQRLATQPHGMTTLTTHDTKRSEDTRARITVLAEIPDEWRALLGRLQSLSPLPDGAIAELLWQAIVGSWPASAERLHAYAEKAAREAGTSTRWNDADAEFEAQMHRLIDDAVGNREVTDEIERFVARVRHAGWSNSLSAKLLQLTGPGAPDVYQGTELWDTSLVDPDNRRPVDFEQRRRMLSAVNSSDPTLPPIDDTAAAKLLVTTRALRARRDRPQLFESYTPLGADGDRAGHAVIVDRGGAVVIATRLPLGLAEAGGWGDTSFDIGERQLDDAVTGRRITGGRVRLADLLDRYPVALLVPLEETS